MSYNFIKDKMYDILVEEYEIDRETIDIISNIMGYNEKTMRDILYAASDERVFSFECNDEEE